MNSENRLIIFAALGSLTAVANIMSAENRPMDSYKLKTLEQAIADIEKALDNDFKESTNGK